MCNGSDHVGQPIAMSLQPPPRTVSAFPFAMIKDMSMMRSRARVVYPGRPRHRPDQGDRHEGHQPSGLTRGEIGQIAPNQDNGPARYRKQDETLSRSVLTHASQMLKGTTCDIACAQTISRKVREMVRSAASNHCP